MEVSVADTSPQDADAELVCVGLFEEEELGDPFAGAPGAEDARGGFKKLALLRPETPARVLVVGLGKRSELDPERLRVAAAIGVREARRVGASTLAWQLPDGDDAGALATALVEGTELAAYRFDRFRAAED
ncbi:MAG TPA: M17 family peptidase N-terminal domain-containing protein, partial [Solirubrobacterales bacterium]